MNCDLAWGMRLFIYDGSGNAQVRELDDRTTSLANVQAIAFVGEDLYFVQPTNFPTGRQACSAG